MESALEMARAACRAGIQTIAATPYLRSDFPGVHVQELAARVQSMREALEREGIPLRIVSGAEVSLIWALEASDEQLTHATYDQRGSDLLIETPRDVTPIEELLHVLRARGLRIILAHP